MDVLSNQLVLNQLWQSTRASNPSSMQDPSALPMDFRNLLNAGQESLPEPDLTFAERDSVAQTVVDDVPLPTEPVAIETVAKDERVLQPDRVTSPAHENVSLPVIQNPYRWFATGIMSFDRNAGVELVSSAELQGRHLNNEPLQTRVMGTAFRYEDASAQVKSGFDFLPQAMISNNTTIREHATNNHVESARAAQHFSATDFLKKRCTVVENVEEIHIIVRDYEADEQQQQLIGAELLQVFSQLNKAVRLTWNGKGYTMNQQKGDSHAS